MLPMQRPQIQTFLISFTLKPSGERVPTSQEQLENNRDTSCYQPTTPTATPTKFCYQSHHRHPTNQFNPLRKVMVHNEKWLCVVKKPSKLDLYNQLQFDTTCTFQWMICHYRIPLSCAEVGSPGGKHGKLLEGNVWRKVVLMSKKPIFEGFGRFFAAILSEMDLDHVHTWRV